MSLTRAFSWTVARAAYPTVLLASLALAGALMSGGVSPGLTTTIAFVATLLVVFALEQTHPHERSWNAPVRESRQNLLYLVLASGVQSVARLAGGLFAALAALALVDVLGPRPWPHAWPPWAQLALALALADVGKYWLHRLAHERPWLWPFHAEHHAPSRMYSLNGVRLHPVNALWNLTLDVGVPLALGLDGRGVALLAVFRGAVSVLQHANVELRLGPLSWLLSTPELHQWHHSARLDESNGNYGSTFIVWDVLFGTRRLPRDRRAPSAVGLADAPVRPSRLRHQLVWPWCASRAATCRWLRGRTASVEGRVAAGPSS